MIHVQFERTRNSITMTLHGHAGLAAVGQDIVCAAASILAYTVAQNACMLNDQRRLRKKPTIRMDKGDIVVVCKPCKRSYAETLHVYTVAQAGYSLLEESYPKYVKLTQFDRGRKPLSYDPSTIRTEYKEEKSK